MKAIMAAVCAGLFAAAAHAQEGPTPEQTRMSECNAQANKQKVMKFSDRKAFVDACMRGETPKKPAAPKKATAKQDKTKACNKQAANKKLKGDERKKFVNQCMKA
jgi:psiF repeat-containing protein